MILQAFQGKRRDEMGKLVQAGGFDAEVRFLGTKGESLSFKEGTIKIFVQMTDMGNPPDRRAHTDDIPATEQSAPHRDLIETRALQVARGAVSPQTISDHVVRESAEE